MSLAYILWLLFSGTLVIGMNRMVSTLLWTVLALIFLLNAWIITRIDSKQAITLLFVCLVIGAAAPYFLAAKRVNTIDAKNSRRYVDDSEQANASDAANTGLVK